MWSANLAEFLPSHVHALHAVLRYVVPEAVAYACLYGAPALHASGTTTDSLHASGTSIHACMQVYVGAQRFLVYGAHRSIMIDPCIIH